jgi:hypothetical protein
MQIFEFMIENVGVLQRNEQDRIFPGTKPEHVTSSTFACNTE